MCSECPTLILRVGEAALFRTKWVKHYALRSNIQNVYESTVPYHLLKSNAVKYMQNPSVEIFQLRTFRVIYSTEYRLAVESIF
jgi:hypothetical protein